VRLPEALIALAGTVMLSDDFLSAMITTMPGTLALRPAVGLRRNCLVNVTAWPAGKDTQLHILAYTYAHTPGYPLAGNWRILDDKIHEKPINKIIATEEPWQRLLLIAKMERS
jgi:hypothetical protein